MNFKKELIQMEQRLSDIKSSLRTPIERDGSNILDLINERYQLFTDTGDLLYESFAVLYEAQSVYYEHLNSVASDYRENQLPIHIKANSEYRLNKKRVDRFNMLIENIKNTQKFIDTRSFDFTNALNITKFVRETTTGL